MEKDKIIKDAQFRKGLSIAFFNATNSAVALVATQQLKDITEVISEVVRIRDFFLDEHTTYYSKVIANVGANYKAGETIEKIKNTKTLDELKVVWLAISEDERRDIDIIRAKEEKKLSYETIQRN